MFFFFAFKLPLFLKIFSFFNSSQINYFSLSYFFGAVFQRFLWKYLVKSRKRNAFSNLSFFAYHSVCVGIFLMILKLSILVASFFL